MKEIKLTFGKWVKKQLTQKQVEERKESKKNYKFELSPMQIEVLEKKGYKFKKKKD